ncbi:hypothetical protein D3C72_1818810 [compost metagenome]
MPLGNGQDGAAEYFGGVGAEAQAEGDGAGGEGIQLQLGVTEPFAQGTHQVDRAEVDQQDPEQLGDPAHECGVGATQPLQRLDG